MGDQGIQHRGVLLLHALLVGVSIGAQGHQIRGRYQAKVALTRRLKRVGMAVEFLVQDHPDRLSIHAVGRHNSEVVLREVEVSFTLGVPFAHLDSHSKLEPSSSIVRPEDGV